MIRYIGGRLRSKGNFRFELSKLTRQIVSSLILIDLDKEFEVIIDAHTHGMHGKYLDKLVDAGGEWAREKLAMVRDIILNRPHFVNPALRVEQLDRCGIDLQVVTLHHYLDCNLLPGEGAAQLVMAKAINDNMARFMEESKGRLLAIGSIPLTGFSRNNRQEMERAIITLGLKGISLPSNLNGKPLDMPEFDSFWAQAAEMNVPVYIHPHDPIGFRDRSYEGEYDLAHNFGWPFETMLMLARLVFSGVMERYPALKIISHHLGGGIPFLWKRIVETYDPSRQGNDKGIGGIGRVLPKPLFDYFSLFYYDTAVGGNGSAIKCAYEVFGADRLLFATDAPWGTGTGECRLAEYPNVIRSLGLSESANQKIFASNACKVLNLSINGS